MSAPVKVRPFQKKDQGPLALVFRSAFSHPPFSEKWEKAQVHERLRQIISDRMVKGWVATVFGQPVGFCFLQLRQGAKEVYGELLETAVHPYFQGQGIEKSLLDSMRRFQKKGRIKNVMVVAFKGAHEKIFRSAGWARSGRTAVYVSR